MARTGQSQVRQAFDAAILDTMRADDGTPHLDISVRYTTATRP